MAKPMTNPSFQADFSKLMGPSKMIGGFKMPGFDMNALMEAQRKNMETITAINQAVFENLQSFAQGQAEMLLEGFEEATNLINAVMSAPTLQEKVVRQGEASKSVTEKCIASAHDAAETIIKCNHQTMETVSHRMKDGLEELHSLTKTSVVA